MKSYTDIQQSMILTKILSLESADYCWGIDDETSQYNNSPYPCAWKDYSCKEYYIPCWSLSALLDILDYPQLSKDRLGSGKTGWMVSVYPKDCRHDSCWHDNPIDACVAMIIRLNELNLL